MSGLFGELKIEIEEHRFDGFLQIFTILFLIKKQKKICSNLFIFAKSVFLKKVIFSFC
jgi:hypothetical protein